MYQGIIIETKNTNNSVTYVPTNLTRSSPQYVYLITVCMHLTVCNLPLSVVIIDTAGCSIEVVP